MMLRTVLFFACVALFMATHAFSQHKLLLITGGHSFEEDAFYAVFDSFANMEYDTVTQPKGNEWINSLAIADYDALIFYDMYQGITEEQKEAYINLLDKGTGMVFLHHALVSYQDWPEFRNIIGGKYLLQPDGNLPKSTYLHDVHIDVHVLDDSHAVTAGMADFTIFDEVYGSFLVNTDVHPLLTTNHKESTREIAWCHQYRNSRIVYLQSGHDHHAYENANFRQLVKNAIEWVIAGK